jgi:hypothetical protein
MTHAARYAITYTGSGIMRLPRAGIFQTGTRAVVDETIARIALAHGSFAVVPLDAAAALAPPVAAPPPVETPPIIAAAAVDRTRRQTRKSAAVRIPE